MLNANGVSNNEYLEYKGRPLVRQGNELYYGDMSEKFYVFMLIMTEKDSPAGDVSIPDKIMIQIIETATKKIENQTLKNGFKEAFELADAWLDRYNK